MSILKLKPKVSVTDGKIIVIDELIRGNIRGVHFVLVVRNSVRMETDLVPLYYLIEMYQFPGPPVVSTILSYIKGYDPELYSEVEFYYEQP